MFTKIATILALMCSFNVPVDSQGVYMRAMEVTNLCYGTDIVTCVDSVGFEWTFEGCEDYIEGDVVCCLMDTMGTEDTILDDTILMTNYSGYYVAR